MSRQRFRTRRRRNHGQDPHWQDVQSSASWLHLRPVPHSRDPTTSLRLAQQVSASHGKYLPHTTSPFPTGAWAQTHDSNTTTDAYGGANLHVMQIQQLAAMQAARPDKSLNAGLTSCAVVTSPSSPTLPHANSARGTQAPSTTRTSLDSGSGVASQASARADQDKPKLLREVAKRPEVNSLSPATRRLPRQGITT
jgi:hypothetical protein